MIKTLKIILLAACIFLSCISCKKADPEPFPSRTKLLKEIYTAEEQAAYNSFIDQQKFIPQMGGAISYAESIPAFNKLSELELKGAPIIAIKAIENELSKLSAYDYPWNDVQGIALGHIQLFSFVSICRVNQFEFYSPCDQAVLPSLNIYSYYKYSTETLPKILLSDKATEEKLEVYRKSGVFAIPYVKSEIEKGNTQFEKFFPLIGAHLTTAEYMDIVEVTDFEKPIPTQEEIDFVLMNSSENFDYKVWLSENEEDLNNLFKFLDAYCAEYEAEQESK